MTWQERIYELMQDGIARTSSQIAQMLRPTAKAWEYPSIRSDCYNACRKLERYGMLKRNGSNHNDGIYWVIA